MTGEIFKSEVSTTSGLLDWAKGALMGDWCVYFTGNISISRVKDKAVGQLADTAFFLSECSWINLSQGRHPASDGYTYMATRTGRGHVPKSVMSQEVSAAEYQALSLVLKRSPDMSATRAIRYGLGVPENIAENILKTLDSRGFVTKKTTGIPWELSPLGRSVLL
ncbi:MULTISPECIES: hypothetical protein [Halocynthiibacter]|uniref:Uncharacterized protein n=1 Tax=Halocynthiibacter halioticoli TaxID=2986804 RepID=A0AAE3J1I2_9RHOB|nr:MULTISPECIES: hypothetical protein [Halocynthiibacter]MCV6826015.1 hypothetical protein [Halocynthiibacter halioticoli]MCW4059016.1 hypothetical protein [Halocynthiibacter sp. SDUM655004]